jgi:hypothetical protein
LPTKISGTEAGFEEGLVVIKQAAEKNGNRINLIP